MGVLGNFSMWVVMRTLSGQVNIHLMRLLAAGNSLLSCAPSVPLPSLPFIEIERENRFYDPFLSSQYSVNRWQVFTAKKCPNQFGIFENNQLIYCVLLLIKYHIKQLHEGFFLGIF